MTDRILVTGATGFLGRHTMSTLVRKYGNKVVKGVSSKDYDLMNPSAVDEMFNNEKPDVVVHLAAYSGGIGANRTYPADFYFQNSILTALTFDQAARRGIEKLVYTMGGCSYPAKATSPIDETQLWNGYPQPESAGYSTAKMMGTVASQSYRQQYGLNSNVLIPGNLYGEYDNFTRLDSHVVPAMIRRYYEAQKDGLDEVVMWGSGNPQRDFAYAGDVAEIIPWFIENFNSSDPVNISAGTRTPIKTLAETIAHLVNFEGEIRWDTAQPDGQMVKIFDTSRLNSLGLSCGTPLEVGLTKTIEWFAENYETQTDGIRL